MKQHLKATYISFQTAEVEKPKYKACSIES
uniref:Uncharacterized protein n=1 Tax=Rhizophora mucronata TaxID=61149 RepID=A0A2P2MH71_RHIMU